MTIKPSHLKAVILAFVCLAVTACGAPGNDQSGDARETSESDQGVHSDNHDDDHDSHAQDGEAEHVDRVSITPDQAQSAGIKTATAGPGTVRQTLSLYGHIQVDPARSATLQARYPGLITSLTASIGDAVEKGQSLATVEASDSLQRYALRAPISGLVVDRMANPGEVVSDGPLLKIADYSTVWAQLAVFPSQAEIIAMGQSVTVRGDGIEADATIEWIRPASDHGPARDARVVLANPEGRWSPGTMVRADVVVDTFKADLVVENKALQTMEGVPVVFVDEGEGYVAQPVALGRSDGYVTEVLAGLAAGAAYVVDNSYLLRAELEKSSASHHH